MKKAFSLLIIFLLSSCNPFDHSGGFKDAPRNRDRAEGEPEFSLPDITDIDPKEIRESLKKEKCENYENTVHVTILGKASWSKPLVNCISYTIDKGIAPLCELEEKVMEVLDEAENEDDEEALEEYLLIIEEEKEFLMEEIYTVSDVFYDSCNSVEDSIDKKHSDKKVLGFVVDLTINSECRSIYKAIDFKARTACKGQNISKLLRKR